MVKEKEVAQKMERGDVIISIQGNIYHKYRITLEQYIKFKAELDKIELNNLK